MFVRMGVEVWFAWDGEDRLDITSAERVWGGWGGRSGERLEKVKVGVGVSMVFAKMIRFGSTGIYVPQTNK